MIDVFSEIQVYILDNVALIRCVLLGCREPELRMGRAGLRKVSPWAIER
jgi:hypothetical protein